MAHKFLRYLLCHEIKDNCAVKMWGWLGSKALTLTLEVINNTLIIHTVIQRRKKPWCEVLKSFIDVFILDSLLQTLSWLKSWVQIAYDMLPNNLKFQNLNQDLLVVDVDVHMYQYNSPIILVYKVKEHAYVPSNKSRYYFNTNLHDNTFSLVHFSETEGLL